MFCFNCGSQIPDNSVFCPECGAKVAAGDAQKEAPEQKPAETVKDKSPVGNPTPKPQKSPPQKGKGKKKRIIAIVAALVLLIAAGGVFAYFHFSGSSFDSNTTDSNTTDSNTTDSNTVGNINSNLMNSGFVTTKNDTVYYVEFVDSSKKELQSMDLNGDNVRTLYTFDGNIRSLNIVGSQIYFVGDTFDENGTVVKSNLFVLNLNDSSVKTIFDPQDINVTPGSASDSSALLGVGDDAQYIDSIFTQGNKIYFKLYKSGVNGIYSMNLDGSKLTNIIQKDSGTMGAFSIADSSFFYQYNEALYRCDFDGDNATKIYYFTTCTFYNYCINDGKIYMYANSGSNGSTIISMDLDGGDQKEIARFEESIFSINVVGDNIYYLEELYDDEDLKVTGQISMMNLDGTDQKVLKTAEKGDLYFSINVYGDWLYFMSGSTSSEKLNINDVTE